MAKLSDFLTPDRIKILASADKSSALEEMFELIASAPQIKDINAFRKAVYDRELQMSTGIGLGIAIPHGLSEAVTGLAIAAGKGANPIQFDSLDDEPVRFIFMIAVGPGQMRSYLECLAEIVTVFKNPELRAKLLAAKEPAELYKILSS
jgi:mannitol/fructose-specific phosphotransferase system IIA component (Ntr-type)